MSGPSQADLQAQTMALTNGRAEELAVMLRREVEKSARLERRLAEFAERDEVRRQHTRRCREELERVYKARGVKCVEGEFTPHERYPDVITLAFTVRLGALKEAPELTKEMVIKSCLHQLEQAQTAAEG